MANPGTATAPAKTRRTQRERSTSTQGLLLDATIDCIVELGWAGASTTAICERAGVSRGAQLHHYPTKERLVAAAIDRLFEARHREFREFLAAQPDLRAAIRALWRIYTGKTFYAWAELLVASRTAPELRARLREVDDRVFAEAVQTCRTRLGDRGGDDARAAATTRLILSILDGLVLNHTLGGRDALSEGVLAELETLLAGPPSRRR